MISVEHSGDIVQGITLLRSVSDNRFMFWCVVNRRSSFCGSVPPRLRVGLRRPLNSLQGGLTGRGEDWPVKINIFRAMEPCSSENTRQDPFRCYGYLLLPKEEKLIIVRTWHGCVPLKHAEGFAKHLESTGVEHSRSIQGEQRRVRAQRNPGRLGAFLSGNLLAGSAVGKGICRRKLSRGGDLSGRRRV